MSKRGNGYGSETRVNILKKIKVGPNWNLLVLVVRHAGHMVNLEAPTEFNEALVAFWQAE